MEKAIKWPLNKKFMITQVANVGYVIPEEEVTSMHKTTQDSISKTDIEPKRGLKLFLNILFLFAQIFVKINQL